MSALLIEALRMLAREYGRQAEQPKQDWENEQGVAARACAYNSAKHQLEKLLDAAEAER